eukprot:6265390-Prymnesium_polylepis.1
MQAQPAAPDRARAASGNDAPCSRACPGKREVRQQPHARAPSCRPVRALAHLHRRPQRPWTK